MQRALSSWSMTTAICWRAFPYCSTSMALPCAPNNDGAKALTGFLEAPADVVLADVNMPVTNGIRLMERIRAVDGETPVIFMTGNAELDITLSAIKMKVFDFIVKPFAPACLIKAIENGGNQPITCCRWRLP